MAGIAKQRWLRLGWRTGDAEPEERGALRQTNSCATPIRTGMPDLNRPFQAVESQDITVAVDCPNPVRTACLTPKQVLGTYE